MIHKDIKYVYIQLHIINTYKCLLIIENFILIMYKNRDHRNLIYFIE